MKHLRFLPVLLCFFLLVGCDLRGGKTYQGTIAIPENGVIAGSVLKQIQKDSAVVTLTGDGYEWTLFGDEIINPRDLNFAVTIEQQTVGALTFRFASDEDFGFAPVLSIHLAAQWDCRNATVYDETGKAVCGASITGSAQDLVNFTIPASTGTFSVRADHETEQTIIAEQSPSAPVRPTDSQPDHTQNGDDYLKPVTPQTPDAVSGGHILSDGQQTEQDKYLTDPVPEGKPMPVESEDVTVNDSKQMTCTFSIECATILNNLSDLNPDKLDVLPPDGIILPAQTVTFFEGESVYDVLQRVCRENNIHMEASWTPIYNSAYVEGIHNLYEFDCGALSGWMYRVNGWYPNYGCSRYQLVDGEIVEWRYTCDLGNDVGGGYAVGGT